MVKKRGTRRSRCARCNQLFDPTLMVTDAAGKRVCHICTRRETAEHKIAPHLIIEARAGTGKTTTLVEGLRRVLGQKSSLTPSPQQAAVWKSMELNKEKVQSACFVAFNKSIATELQSRVPPGCDAMTLHSMGCKVVQRAFGSVQINKFRVQDIIGRLLNQDVREIRRRHPQLLRSTESLVGLCKMNLVNPGFYDGEWPLESIASYYDIETNGYQDRIFDLVPRVLEQCKDVDSDRQMDFNDMIWLPVILGLSTYKYDLLLVDEAQDLNRCQQVLARMCGDRLVLCGDPKQAIYGFAGADAQSMSRLEKVLSATERGCKHLMLTVTRRCGKAIVTEAQKIVPDFEAFAENPEGQIDHMGLQSSGGPNGIPHPSFHQSVQPGDMILCRCNAPLVSECFRFLRLGVRANIQGRDVGQGLIRTVEKLAKMGSRGSSMSDEIAQLQASLDEWYHTEQGKELARRNPSDQRLINLRDKMDCLLCFMEEAKTVEDVIKKINSVFTDDKEAKSILLSSVHKAKGLEAKRVFILVPKESPMPHPMAKSPWEFDQEMNIKYVAITRAIELLVWVS